MPDEVLVLSLLEKVVESGSTPEVVCADHPELLAEVRDRLARLGRVQEELDALFPEPGPTQAEATLQPRPGDLPAVPGHDVEAILGYGGMGVVYRARHVRLNRPVAVKMMLAGMYAGPQELARFRREAEALAELGHPNIVQVHEAGDLDGLPYFTMELVEGGTLADKLAGAPQAADQAVALVSTLAGAVQAAHDRGIVHRDLKPANVLLMSDGTPKISDFGVARRLDPGPNLTRTGVRVGTPSYMAPEQAAGAPGAVGPAVDVYALGAVLYELLTGRPPFRADTAAETERQVIAEDPAPPSRLNAKVPRDLETICLKCLHKDPRRRYASAVALADDLGRFQRGETIAARPAGMRERVGKWVRRHPTRAAAALGGILVAVALLATGWWVLAERAARTRAVEGDLGEAEQALEQSDWPKARAAIDRAQFRLGGRGPDELRRRLDRVQRGLALGTRLDDIPLRRAVTSVRMSQGAKLDTEKPGRPYRAATGFDMSQADREYRAAFEEGGLGTINEPPETVAGRVRASAVRGAILAALDDWVSCVRDDRRRWMFEVARRSDDGPESAWQHRARQPEVWKNPSALAELARVAPRDARFIPLQLTIARQLMALNERDGLGLLRQVQAAHPNDFWVAFSLGEVLAARDDPTAAGFVRAAIAARPGAIVAYLLLGDVLGSEGRLGEAVEQFGRALVLDPANDLTHFHLARCLYFQGLPGPAVEHCREAIRLDPRWGPPHVVLGESLLDLGRFDEARAAFERGLELLPAEVPMVELAQQLLRRGARWRELEGRVDGILRGTDRPAGPAEGIELAEVCARKRRFATAAGLYTNAFAADPGLSAANRGFQAARAAVQAGCGEGEDAAVLDDPTRAAMRRQALTWLRVERDVLSLQYTRAATREGRKAVIWILRYWTQDPAFAGVRDKPGLARLSEDERRQWQAFWTIQERVLDGEMFPTLESARAAAVRREWELAAESYSRFVTLIPTNNANDWFEFAAVQQLAGDREGYRHTRGLLSERFPGLAGVRPYLVARACTLAPDEAGDLARATRLSATELSRNAAMFWSLTEKAALLHRAGRSQAALPLLEHRLAADSKPGTQVTTWLWLALAYQRLGRANLAEYWLDKAGRWLDQFPAGMPADGDPRYGLHLHNWLEAHALRKEAESLLRPSPVPK